MPTMFARPDTSADGSGATSGDAARRLAGAALAAALAESRRRTLSLVADLSDAQWQVPCCPGLNPIAWELAHLAWFGEFWILRGPHRLTPDGLVQAAQAARIAGPDALFDSARLAHAQRWQRPLPGRADVLAMLERQLDACLRALPGGDGAEGADGGEGADAALYFHRLSLFHEDMHGEALTWLRAALGYPAPAALAPPPAQPAAGRLRFEGGTVRLGRRPGQAGFAFDNELPGAQLQLAPFDIDAGLLTAGQFLEFVLAGGYREPACWPGAARAWLAASQAAHPARWRRTPAGGWEQRWFERWLPLDPGAPLLHVNAFEAEAYCRWAGRRLPRAAEWELAASTAGGRGFCWGHSAWEWCAEAFEPYAGFVPGPYKDYSQPWFGSHRELRGGSCAAHARLHDTAYRNFFMPQRNDIFAGLRTAGPG